MEIPYQLFNNSLVLIYDGKTVTIAKGDERYDQVIKCIDEKRWEDIPDIVEIERQYESENMQLIDGLIHIEGKPVPNELSTKIMAFKEKRHDYGRLLRFWENLKENPSFNSRQMLFKFLEHNGHPLTEDGCFIAYRGVTDEFKDCHTKSFDNSPGSVCKMHRSEVDENPNNTCSNGLHVASWSYAKGFGSKNVLVKVNPKDVVCVPTDYNGTKMRVCQFEVLQECQNMRDELIYDEEALKEEDYEACWYCGGTDHDPFAQFCSECGAHFED